MARILRRLKLAEISAVDKPAQEGAKALVVKRLADDINEFYAKAFSDGVARWDEDENGVTAVMEDGSKRRFDFGKPVAASDKEIARRANLGVHGDEIDPNEGVGDDPDNIPEDEEEDSDELPSLAEKAMQQHLGTTPRNRFHIAKERNMTAKNMTEAEKERHEIGKAGARAAFIEHDIAKADRQANAAFQKIYDRFKDEPFGRMKALQTFREEEPELFEVWQENGNA